MGTQVDVSTADAIYDKGYSDGFSDAINHAEIDDILEMARCNDDADRQNVCILIFSEYLKDIAAEHCKGIAKEEMQSKIDNIVTDFSDGNKSMGITMRRLAGRALELMLR